MSQITVIFAGAVAVGSLLEDAVSPNPAPASGAASRAVARPLAADASADCPSSSGSGCDP